MHKLRRYRLIDCEKENEVATYVLDLDKDEAVALTSIVEAATISGKNARIVASILNKMDVAAVAYNISVGEQSQPETPKVPAAVETPKVQEPDAG